MNRLPNLHSEIVDVLSRIERLNEMIQLHEKQPSVDPLAIEGYERLRKQYISQLEDLLSSLNIRADIHLRAAWMSIDGSGYECIWVAIKCKAVGLSCQ